jgi:hypothetical protein
VTEKEDMASICRELLADVRAFTKLTEMAIALSQVLVQSQTAEGEPNPLARRLRLEKIRGGM